MQTRSIALACCACLVIALTGCNKYQEKVIGTWVTNFNGVNVEWTFNKDGSGALVNPGVKSKPFTWRLRGNNLIFNTDGKDVGFLIESADENQIHANDPQGPGGKPTQFVMTRKK